MQNAIDALPAEEEVQSIQTLETPHRLKFRIDAKVSDYSEGSAVCDVACLEDLDCFSELISEVVRLADCPL